jgi:hypothetical protein
MRACILEYRNDPQLTGLRDSSTTQSNHSPYSRMKTLLRDSTSTQNNHSPYSIMKKQHIELWKKGLLKFQDAVSWK